MNWFVRPVKSEWEEFFVLILRSAGDTKNGYRPNLGVIICSKNDRKNWFVFIIKTPWQQMLTAQYNYKGEIY